MSDNEVAVKAHIGAADVKLRSSGRTFDTLLAQPAVCGRGCDAATPAPVGSAAPCRGRTNTRRSVKTAHSTTPN